MTYGAQVVPIYVSGWLDHNLAAFLWYQDVFLICVTGTKKHNSIWCEWALEFDRRDRNNNIKMPRPGPVSPSGGGKCKVDFCPSWCKCIKCEKNTKAVFSQMRMWAVLVNQCVLQFADMTLLDKDFWKFFETMPQENASDEVFAAHGPAMLAPPSLHSASPSTPPLAPNKSGPHALTPVPSPTRWISPALSLSSHWFEHFF